MPHIAITMKPGRSQEIKQDLAVKMKQALIDALKVDPSVVTVSIEDIPGEQWEDHVAAIPAAIKFDV